MGGTQDATIAFFGVLVSVSSVAMIAANSLGGLLADRVGKKKVITLAAGILTPSLLVYTIVPNVFWVGVAYFVHMFSMSLFQPAFTAFVADSEQSELKGQSVRTV